MKSSKILLYMAVTIFIFIFLILFCSTEAEYNNNFNNEDYENFNDFENFNNDNNDETDIDDFVTPQTINPKKIVGDLIATFTDPETKKAENALMNLRGIMQDKKIRTVSIIALTNNLNHDNPKMRMRCAQALKRDDMPPKVKTKLEDMIFIERNASVLVSVFDSLSLIGDNDTIEVLNKKVNSTENQMLKDFANSSIRVIKKRLDKKAKEHDNE
jgi:hypothetical protein